MSRVPSSATSLHISCLVNFVRPHWSPYRSRKSEDILENQKDFPADAPALGGGLSSREPSDSVHSQVCAGNHHSIQKEAKVKNNFVLPSWCPLITDGPRMPSGDFLLCVHADTQLLETERGCGEREGGLYPWMWLDPWMWFSLPTNVLWVFCEQTGGLRPGNRMKA